MYMYMQLVLENCKTEVHKPSVKIYYDTADSISITKQV